MDKHAALGSEVVHHREDALLHFAGVFGAQNHQFAVFEVQADAGSRTHARGVLVGRKAAGVVDHEVGLAEIRQLLARRPDEHGVHEQGVIRTLADDAHFDAVVGIPSGKAVEAIEPLADIQVIDGALAHHVEGARVERDVDRAPPDVVFRLRILYDALVFWRAARLGARVSDQRAVVGDAGVFVVADGVLVERTGRQVVKNLLYVQTKILEVECVHRYSPFKKRINNRQS